MRNRLLAFFIIWLVCNNIYAQNSGSLDSTKVAGFARFLYDQKLYELAAEEYERLTFLFPAERLHLISLFKCYRQINQFEKIEFKAKNANLDNEEILKEYILSLALNDQIEIASLIFNERRTILNPSIAARIPVDLDLLAGKYKDAELKYKSLEVKDPAYYNLILEGTKMKQKSPFAAGLFSGLVPGSGRVYSNDYKDGILSFVFIAGTAFQSYQRFNAKGVKSVGGWVYGGFSLGFYVANIYGSIKSAKNYNKKIKSRLNEKSKSYINTFYSL